MENLVFTSIAEKSVVERILDTITDAIVSGALRPGDKLPTEMELAQSMGVGRNSVREAIKILVSMGVLDIRRAEGTFVTTGFKNRMLDPVLYGLILENGPADEVIELRRIFEAGVMQLAVEKATAEDIAELGKALRRLSREAMAGSVDLGALHEADLQFHEALERAAHNSLTVKIGQLISRLTTPTRRNAAETFIMRGQAELLVSLHQQLLDVIIERKPELTLRAIEDHYQYWIHEFDEN